MYSQEKINIALELYHQCGAVMKTSQTPSCPARRTLYGWIDNEGKPRRQRKVANPGILVKILSLFESLDRMV